MPQVQLKTNEEREKSPEARAPWAKQSEEYVNGPIKVFLVVTLACTIQLALSAQAANGALYVGTGTGMYPHIADAVATLGLSRSGTIILTAGYTDVITSTLNVGHLDGPGIKVIMLPGSTIQENITDGSPGIKIMEGSSLECLGAASSGSINGVLSTCQVLAGGSANMASMVTSGAMDMGRGQDMFSLQGITFEPGGATVTAVGDFEGITTPSLIANNNFFGGPNVTYVWHIGWGTGGGIMFVNNELRGAAQVTGALVYITGGEAGYQIPTSPGIAGGEMSCRGPGAPMIKIDGDPTGSGAVGVIDAIFERIWNQDCGGATLSSPYVSIHNADHVVFKDMDLSTPVSPIVSISESAPGMTDFISFDNMQVFCQNVNCAGQTNWISDTTASGYTHTLPPVTVNLQRYVPFTYIAHDQAGNWPQLATYQGPGGGSAAPSQTDVNLTVTQSGTVGSISYPDASAGYTLRVQDQGAINMDFGANGYADSWIESYQNGTTTGKPLNINTKYGGSINFGGDVFGPNFTFTQSGTVGSSTVPDASAGYAWRVRNQGAADLDFGVNGYSNSWIESHQEDRPLGKTLNINTKYGGWTFFGGNVFAPSFTLNNGDQVTAMPSSSAITNRAACVLSPGPPIVLGRCTSGIRDDGSCSCR